MRFARSTPSTGWLAVLALAVLASLSLSVVVDAGLSVWRGSSAQRAIGVLPDRLLRPSVPGVVTIPTRPTHPHQPRTGPAVAVVVPAPPVVARVTTVEPRPRPLRRVPSHPVRPPVQPPSQPTLPPPPVPPLPVPAPLPPLPTPPSLPTGEHGKAALKLAKKQAKVTAKLAEEQAKAAAKAAHEQAEATKKLAEEQAKAAKELAKTQDAKSPTVPKAPKPAKGKDDADHDRETWSSVPTERD